MKIFELLLLLAHVWKKLDELFNHILDVLPLRLIASIAFLYMIATSGRRLITKWRAVKGAILRGLRRVLETCLRWVHWQENRSTIAAAEKEKSSAEQYYKELNFPEGNLALEGACNLLAPLAHDHAVLKDYRVYGTELRALRGLGGRWESGDSASKKKDFSLQRAIICNVSADCLRGGCYDELPIYKWCCAKLLCRLIEQAIQRNDTRNVKEWFSAATAASYLGWMAADQKNKVNPDTALCTLIEDAFARWEKGSDRMSPVFRSSLSGARKILDISGCQLN